MNIQSPHVALRAALYLRVSTARQAEHDVSIPDQKRRAKPIASARLSACRNLRRAGASATTAAPSSSA
jgi:DNA invertase Pin-like site-specific DNA recombinase